MVFLRPRPQPGPKPPDPYRVMRAAARIGWLKRQKLQASSTGCTTSSSTSTSISPNGPTNDASTLPR